MDKAEERRAISEYLKNAKVNWEDLSESEKKVFGFIYNRHLGDLRIALEYEVFPKLKELEERTKTTLVEVDDVDKFIKENEKAIVDVWGLGCLPCNLVVPVMEKLARKNKGFAFGRKDIEDKKFGKKYNIKVLPTLFFFDNGKVRKRIEGAPPDDIIKAEVEALKVPKEEFDKRLKITEAIAKAKGWKVNPNPYLRNMLIVGLIKNKGFCPCKPQKVNEHLCPCQPSKFFKGAEKEIEETGHCHCGLFFDQKFKGKITAEYILKHFRESGVS